MGTYLPSSEEDRARMLAALGLTSADELYAAVPPEARIRELDLPQGLTEMEVAARMASLAGEDRVFPSVFRGAGAYRHYIPSIVTTVTAKEEFVTAYTPYQAEISQGVLQSIFEYQTQICELTGMDVSNASVYDGASAAAESLLMFVDGRRKKSAVISGAVHPDVLETVKTYCESRGVPLTVLPVKGHATDPEDVRQALSGESAAFLFQHPNYYGILEDAEALVAAAHEAGAKAVMSVNPISLGLLKTPADTIAAATLYLRIYFAGVPFILILNMESNMLRAVGNSVSPFLYMVAGCLSNIALDFLFVVGFRWGVAGVAVATVAAQILNMSLLTRKLMTTGESYHLQLSELKLRGVYLTNMLRLGIPAGLQAAMYGVSNMVVQVGVNTLGTVVVASWAMTSKTDGVFWAVSSAFGAAVTSFVGQNLGAGRRDRVQQCVREGLILFGIIAAFLSALILLAGRPLLHVLTEDPEVIETTYRMMTYFVPFYLLWVVIEVLSAVLRGSGDAVRPVIIIGIGICLLRILWIVTVFAEIHTVLVLCLCYPVSWAVTSLAIFLYFRRGRWNDRDTMILDH